MHLCILGTSHNHNGLMIAEAVVLPQYVRCMHQTGLSVVGLMAICRDGLSNWNPAARANSKNVASSWGLRSSQARMQSLQLCRIRVCSNGPYVSCKYSTSLPTKRSHSPSIRSSCLSQWSCCTSTWRVDSPSSSTSGCSSWFRMTLRNRSGNAPVRSVAVTMAPCSANKRLNHPVPDPNSRIRSLSSTNLLSHCISSRCFSNARAAYQTHPELSSHPWCRVPSSRTLILLIFFSVSMFEGAETIAMIASWWMDRIFVQGGSTRYSYSPTRTCYHRWTVMFWLVYMQCPPSKVVSVLCGSGRSHHRPGMVGLLRVYFFAPLYF